MAKINIILNNTTYQIDESLLASATAALKAHLTAMNGEGATIQLGGIAYNIDATKLAAATSEFISHLGSVAGEGAKVVIGGIEYSVDSSKMADAFESFEGALGELENSGESELGFPITWNTMEAIDNTPLPMGEWGAVKVSDYIPSVDEMANTTITVTDAEGTRIFEYKEIYDTGMFYIVDYKWAAGNEIAYMGIYIIPTTIEGDGIAFEAGLYADNYGSIGVNADCVLDIMPEEHLDGTVAL